MRYCRNMQTTLLMPVQETEQKPPPPKQERPTIDFLAEHAKEVNGLPANWKVFHYKCLPNVEGRHTKTTHYQLTGAVCDAVYQSGRHKGRTNWAKKDKSTLATVIIGVAEHEAFLLRWEAKTGKCHKCYGTGQEWRGWNCETGDKYGMCGRCGGSGNAKR